AQVRKYAEPVDRESARELLAKRIVTQPEPPPAPMPGRAGGGKRPPPSTFETILKSPTTRTLANTVLRGVLGALLGSAVRRRPRL
ncbi:MAG: hypothetical protein ACRD08_01440, partial [Acidimicrobiales bacterium]